MQGKVAIVTGASGGLGQVIAAELGKAGAAVVVHYWTHEEQASLVVQDITKGGGKALSIAADVTDAEAVASMAQHTVHEFGRIDILINNVGISRDAMSWKMDLESWSTVLDVNLTGAFLCARAVLPVMRSQRWGRVINISSIVAQVGVAGTSAYAASKAGLIGLTKTLAREVIGRGITVNCLALGYFDAGMMLSLNPELQQAIRTQIPMGRLGEPEEVVHAIRFLCDDKAGYITGTVLNLNGGLYM